MARINSPTHEWLRIVLLFSTIMIVAGIGIIATVNMFPTVIVHHISVQETQTDWYESGLFTAQSGDWFDISVQTFGGNGKLVVRRQDGHDIFGEVQSSFLAYEVPVDKTDTYEVIIWTREWPYPSNYIDLSGTIDLKRVVFSPYGYLAVSLIAGGTCIIIGGILLYRHQIIQAKKLEVDFRDCPSCGRRVPITQKICPYCGHDIVIFVKCRNCGASYDRSMVKCPICGAPKR